QAAGFGVEVVSLPAGGHLAPRVGPLADSGLYEAVLSLTDLSEAERPRLGTTPIVSAPVYDRKLRGVGPLSEADRMAEVVTGLAELGHRELLPLGGDDSHPSRRRGLAALGHREPRPLAGAATPPSARRRREAFQRTVAQLGLPEGATIDCRWDPDRASRTVSELPASSGITAVLADDDVLAAGAIRGAGESGRQVPEDLSVTGWGDLPLGAWSHASLTTVRIDHHRHGVELLEELLRVMRGDDPSMDRPSITEVLWRESTGPAPDRARKR